MTSADPIGTLNTLIETCRDGERGFRTAADAVGDADLKRLFATYGMQRAEFARELEAEVRRLGAEPSVGGSVTGTLHRGWMSLKAAVTGRDDGAVVAAAEAGEEAAQSAYEEALRALAEPLRQLIGHQLEQIRDAHDHVRALKPAA
jgi:uncharacterized protein (TIGR02284 family)